MIWVGIDLMEVERLKEAVGRHPRLISRVFHPDEVAYAEGPHYWHRLAARFAGKEAVVKACRGFRRSAWRDIVIRGAVNQPPQLTVDGPLGEWVAAQGGRLTISLTHERHMVGAVAVLEVPDGDPGLDGRGSA
jgi:holo-[acyl-carrier protein] synthase